jgi:hypothetical protein
MGGRTFLPNAALQSVMGILLLAACASQPGPESAAPEGATQVEVLNHSSLDMDIFVSRSGQRVRLGTVTGNLTKRFTIQPGQVAGVGTVEFLAVPVVGGLARSISSEPILLGAGKTVELEIPPP